MIWTCTCGADGVAFYPGSAPDVVPGLNIVVSKGESGRVLCLAHFQSLYCRVEQVGAAE